LIGPELVQETTEKIFQIKERLKTARSHQKSYADKRRMPLEFKVGDRVLLKVSPWKGWYDLERSCVHDTFHVSNLKKCLAEPDVQVPLDEIKIDENMDLLKKYVLADNALLKCRMLPPNNLVPDESGIVVNETLFKGMIGSLMYLISSRPDIQISTCLCARYQANPKESHLVVVKRIFMYLKGTLNLGLWYPKGSGFDLKAYSDSD
ncbi:hypothetical protein Tco_1187264, partial [Tanacetum coccineum]